MTTLAYPLSIDYKVGKRKERNGVDFGLREKQWR